MNLMQKTGSNKKRNNFLVDCREITTNPHWTHVVGHGLVSLSIHEEGQCPSSGDIKWLIMKCLSYLIWDWSNVDPLKAWQGEYLGRDYLGREYLAPPGALKLKCSTFQGAMKFTVMMGQCFGLMPVLGITEIDTSKLRFKIISWRSIYSLISLFVQCIFTSFCYLRLIKDTEVSLSSNTSIVFYTSNVLTTLLFYRIATKWPRLSQHISRLEAADPTTDDTLVKRCNASCIAILGLAIVEHVLSILSGIAGVLDCQPDKPVYETFIRNSYPWIYSFVPYNNVIGPITQFINIQCTFNWNFAGVFVICMSIYLTSRLDQVNRRIIAVKGKYVPSTFWRAMREDYCRTTALVRRVDEVIGGVIFISFANNLFFICLQLLHTMEEGIRSTPPCHHDDIDERPLKGYEQATYFVYSFVFLVARSLVVSLIAAQVHTASKKPAFALYEVSSATYCLEIQRFLDQIHTDTVGLSGIQFFTVKRGLVLTIAGTIVTYELVLMQFTGVTPTAPTPTSK